MKNVFPVLTFVLFVHIAIGQNIKKPTLSADSAIALFRENYPQEKVFLQSDKATYFPGETIWMKAWCTAEGMPTYLSHILYVDLVNSQGDVIQKKMYKLDDLGSTAADMEITSGIKSGNYTINAYTLWMLNFPQFVYHRNIYVYNADDYKKSTATSNPGLKIQFFPEGGDMIAGLKNRIAFKAVDKTGLPVDIKGVIVDNAGAKVSDFNTEHDGLGAVEIDVAAGKTYIANVTTATGNVLTFRLPVPKDEGVSLRIENTNPNRLFVLVNRADKNKEKYNKLHLLAQMYYQPVFEADLNFDEGQTAAPISKKNLPAGLMHVTIFDAQNNPLAERLVFIENYALNTPAVKIDSLNTKARGKNQISFSLDSKNASSISCLVTSDLLDTLVHQENNIASAFLVTTDMPGYINNPGYYFKDKDAQTLHHLDLLLMTQGWRRFEWKKVLQNDYAKLQYPVESAMTLRGTVTKSDRKEVVKEGKVSFIIKGDDSTSIMAEASLTDKGEFLLSDVNYKKRAKVAYMGTNNKAQNYIVDVKLAPAYIDSLKRSGYVPVVDVDTIDIINRRNSLAAYYIYGQLMQGDSSPFDKAKLLQGVTVTAKKLSPEDSLNKEYAGGPFLMGKSIDPSSIKFARTIWQVIQQTVPGVTVEGNPFDPTVSFNRFNGLSNQGGNATVDAAGSSDGSISADMVLTESNGIAYFLNEVNVSKDVINTLAVEDVALIKVLKNEGAALGASQGVIAIYTKKGVVVGKAVYDKAYATETREGYAVTRQFYVPDYTSRELRESKEADKRNTLYWNANIHPAKDGQYRFRFYNNDTGRKFKLIIQGIGKDGQLIYTEQVIR